MNEKKQFHGSDLEKIEEVYHVKKENIINFSSNVNPLGISKKMKQSMIDQIDAITTYPDREYLSLRKSIATYVSCDIDHILLGNGSSELISNIIKMRAPKTALILAPTYSEYERELSLNHSTSTYFPLKAEDDFKFDFEYFCTVLSNHAYDMFILCNPNNPTSTALTKNEIKKILEISSQSNTFVMIDETYIEFTNNVDLYSAASLTFEFKNLAVLRGTSKFFASPGLRLGYALTSNEAILDQSNQEKNPWMIHSLAVIAGENMFFDTEYIEHTRNYIHQEETRVLEILSTIPGLKIFSPAANFILLQLTYPNASAKKLFEFLLKKNLMIRNCSTFPFLDDTYIRLCILKKNENDLLLSELKNYILTQ